MNAQKERESDPEIFFTRITENEALDRKIWL
jgi:hypothetical protein